MRTDFLVGNIPVSLYEDEKCSFVRVVSPTQERRKYAFFFEDFTQFNDFLRKRLGYETKQI